MLREREGGGVISPSSVGKKRREAREGSRVSASLTLFRVPPWRCCEEVVSHRVCGVLQGGVKMVDPTGGFLGPRGHLSGD